MLKKTTMIAVLFSSMLFGLAESDIKSEMNSRIQTIITVLQDKSLSDSAKKVKIYESIGIVFDYKTMSKISLGRVWKTLNSEEKSSFITVFEQKLKNSYFEKLELYTDEKVVVKSLEKTKSTRIKLYSDIVGAEENYEVIYKFYKVKHSSDWRIYDIEITGVSIVQTYRKQFAEFLKSKSFADLLASL